MVTFVSMHLSSNRSNVRYNNNFSDNFILLVMICITFSLSNSHVSLKRRLLMNGTTTASYFATIHLNATMVLCDVIGKLLPHFNNEAKENCKF